ncbi:hypothetical protein [Siminovitchia fordii]|uniref:Uncharacterized protein n=1 Tax=Siminovitchia fordii TaxID=254759 RepID=A0ABQ4KCH5_9BACI|nr:hypothetical protein [Siminovitchia fordii]GIN22573.1 hypothetical protein J1TS3_37070 [Siminovitchia fordii]
MRLDDVILNNSELTVGEDCYYDHNKYTYKGVNEEGKHIVSRKNRNEEITKYLDAAPQVPALPLGLYFENKRTKRIGELTDYSQMLGKMYYRLTIYDDVFKGYDLETLGELQDDWELLAENPFSEDGELVEEIDEINSEIRE